MNQEEEILFPEKAMKNVKFPVLMGLTILMAGLMAGCTAAIPKESLNQVDPGVAFEAVVRNPEEYKGKVILAGGQILGTTVQEGQTWVEVLQHPLDWKQRPQNTDVSSGRFLIRYDGFVDPAIYSQGKMITVVGEVMGKRILPLKEMQYSYPVLKPRDQYLWKPEASYGGAPNFHIGIGVGGVFH
jgi:outer membrane lipoprotein